jgi:ribosomal protein S18 acetylase RimI-like enzyme
MDILGYDEVDGQQVLELNIKAFGWFLSPDQIRFIRSVDKRVPDYVALYAVEDNAVQSQVGVVTLDTQCTHGTEKVGYIWGVATKPSQARSGYATKLIEEANKRLKEEGIRYCFLGTGKSLVAYDLYVKLGYRDFTMLKRGLKGCQTKEKSEITFKTEVDNEIVVDLFNEYSKDLMGFVKRPKNFMEVRKAWSWFQYDLEGTFYENETPIGYLVANKEGKVLKIWELCCPEAKDIKKCISALESDLEFEHILLECVSGSAREKDFVESGFELFSDSWGILMLKDLKGEHSINDVKRSFGIDERKFHMTSIDEY